MAPRPGGTNLRIEYGRTLTVATFNVQGMKQVCKREEVECWMIENEIRIVLIQETHIKADHVERRMDHHWYFSARTDMDGTAVFNGGVAIVINMKIINTIGDIEPINNI